MEKKVVDPKTNYVQTSTGEIIPYKLFSNDYTRKDNLLVDNENNGHSPFSNKNEDNIQFAKIERQWTNNNFLSFESGTKINNYDDVAWLFRSLENEAIEHLFVVYQFQDDSFMVQQVSSGGTTQTLVENILIAGPALEMNPKGLFLVHNHPSGNLKASSADYSILTKLKEFFRNTDIKVHDGVIINLRSGKYALFSESSNTYIMDSINKQDQVQQDINIYSFSKQILSENFQLQHIKSSTDVAKFISTRKYGVSNKTELLILTSNNDICAKLILPENYTENDIAKYVANFGGKKAIVYTNQCSEATIDKLQRIRRDLNTINIELLDVIEVKSENEQRLYRSLADEGILFEPTNNLMMEDIEIYNDKPLNRTQIAALVPKERQGTSFHIKVSKDEAEVLLKEGIIDDVMNAEYGDEQNLWVGMTIDDLDEKTNKFDEDYKTFEIDVSYISKSNLIKLMNDIDRIQQTLNKKNDSEIVFGVNLGIVVQSHLSDAIIELQINPTLAKQRLNFLKTIIHSNVDLSKEVSKKYLDDIWNSLETSSSKVVSSDNKLENNNFNKDYKENNNSSREWKINPNMGSPFMIQDLYNILKLKNKEAVYSFIKRNFGEYTADELKNTNYRFPKQDSSLFNNMKIRANCIETIKPQFAYFEKDMITAEKKENLKSIEFNKLDNVSVRHIDYLLENLPKKDILLMLEEFKVHNNILNVFSEVFNNPLIDDLLNFSIVDNVLFQNFESEKLHLVNSINMNNNNKTVFIEVSFEYLDKAKELGNSNSL